jgi:transcriptional regulator with XRE-family HTH domain
VPEHGSPSVRRRRLAAELRRLRERAGFIGEAAATRLGWSPSKLSRIETSKAGVKQDDLLRLLALYEVSDAHRDELLALTRESARARELEVISARLPGEHAEFLNVEAEAESVWNWEPQIVPGLLQTEDYARAVMRGWHAMFTGPPSEIERRVEARRLRQQVLRRDPPLQLSVVMDESVLHRQMGEPSVMRQQLEHIIEISQLPNVMVRVLPLNGGHRVVTGAFTYIRFPQLHDIPLNDIVTLEHLTGTGQLDAQDDTYKYYVAFGALEENSFELDRSREELAKVTRRKWS